MKKKSLLLSACLVSSILLLQGCASHGNESLRAESEMSVKQKIIENKTTKQDVKSMFGSPLNTSFTDNGSEIWRYELANMSADAVSYIPVVSMFGGSSSGTKKELVLLFNDDSTVKKYTMSESDVQVKTGLFNN